MDNVWWCPENERDESICVNPSQLVYRERQQTVYCAIMDKPESSPKPNAVYKSRVDEKILMDLIYREKSSFRSWVAIPYCGIRDCYPTTR